VTPDFFVSAGLLLARLLQLLVPAQLLIQPAEPLLLLT
jgi:hypothetical protein